MLNLISYDVTYDENAGQFRQMAFPTCISLLKIKKLIKSIIKIHEIAINMEETT